MAALDLTATMDALAAAMLNVTGVTRSFAWPVEDVDVGDAVVGYPTEPIEIGTTFGRGADQTTFPVWVICGMAQDKASRDFAADFISGSTDVSDQVNGTLSGAVQIAHVARCTIDRLELQGLQHLSVRFDIEVTS